MSNLDSLYPGSTAQLQYKWMKEKYEDAADEPRGVVRPRPTEETNSSAEPPAKRPRAQ